eukprot:TRINITY_DN8802_c0_g1_i3.p1 TRINITY_DN8802_c0_g1~~TRINITY_DN8802_c0_g1_i3.p1  ORF type:complete len:646 (-),score=64.00 TRINITY_DN8802_c0_g1_i3:424-2361(-)
MRPRKLEIYCLACLALTCLSLPDLSLGQQDVNQFMNTKVKHVRGIAARVKEVWDGDCSGLQQSCKLSRLNCANDLGLSGQGCNNSIYAETFQDVQCPCNTTQFNFNEGFIRLPKYAKPDDEAIMQTVCRLQKLDRVFKPILEDDSEQLQIYFGAVNGAFRIYPGGPREFDPPDAAAGDLQSVVNNCAAYDPRLRPWFRDALLGPKSVIILMDLSADMNNLYSGLGSGPTNLDVAKAAVRTVLGTLRAFDHFSVITFGASVKTLNSTTGPRLLVWEGNVNATVFQELDAVTAPDKNSPGGTSRNHTAGLAEAFAALKGNPAARCEKKMILLFSKGEDTSSTNDEIVSFIERAQIGLNSTRANILTFSLLDTTSNGPLLKRIACANQGVYTNIDVASAGGVPQAEAAMPNYLIPYYVLGGSAEETIFWTEGYPSATRRAQDKELTAAMAVKDAKGNLLGVVGVDMSATQLQKYNGEQLISEYATNTTKNCRPDPFTECDIQALRAYNTFLTRGESSVCDITPPLNCPALQSRCQTTLTSDKVYAGVGTFVPYQTKACCSNCGTGGLASTDSGNGSGKTKDTWTLPVIIVICVVFLAALCAAGLLYRRRIVPREDGATSSPAPTTKEGLREMIAKPTEALPTHQFIAR